MANVCSVRLKKKICENRLKSILSELSEKRFLSQLMIEYEYESTKLVCFSIKVKENQDFGGYIWINQEGKHFEWKHNYDSAAWWLISYVTSYLFNQINPRIKIKDDGIDTKLNCDFHIKYPKPLDWIRSLHSAGIRNSPIVDSLIISTDQTYSKYLPKFWKVANKQ